MTTALKRRLLAMLLFSALVGATFARSHGAGSYETGMLAYDAGDLAKALEIWEPLAEAGDAVTQFSLGKLLENGGEGVEPDLAEAAKWYERSANQGVSAAQNNLGLMYAQGRGVPRDVARAAQLWQSAAGRNHAIAQFNLGLAYFIGEGVQEDRALALRWFRRAGELGLAPAQFTVAQVLRMGLAAEADEAEALHWYELAAAQGDRKARTQAEHLREAGVKPRARTAEAPAAEAPTDPATEAPAEAPAQAPVEAPAQAAAVPPGLYRIWLISLRDAAEANRYLEAARAKYPEIFTETPGAVASADLGEGGVFHRVVAGELPSQQAARDLCGRLHARDPAAFCKVLAN